MISKTVMFNPFTPRSDQSVNSVYHFNTMSSRQLMRIKKIISRGYCFYITPNSQQRNLWSSVRRIIFQILGVKGLKQSPMVAQFEIISSPRHNILILHGMQILISVCHKNVCSPLDRGVVLTNSFVTDKHGEIRL